MKKFGKFAAIFASAIIALTMCAALSACDNNNENPDGDDGDNNIPNTGSTEPKDYTFEAENAVITDGEYLAPVYENYVPTGEYETTYVDVTYETATEYGTGDEVTCMGYFYGGSKLTWKITSDKECDATLKLRASSCGVLMPYAIWTAEEWDNFYENFGWSYWWIPYSNVGISPVEFTAESQPVTLTVNGTAVNLIGTLPGVDPTPDETADSGYKTIDNAYYYFGTVEATVHLVAGENVIVITGPADGTSVCNPDKIIINTDATLTWKPTNNADRES